MYRPGDHRSQKASKQGYKARSVFKLEEIDQKWGLLDKEVSSVLDIGCAPGSRLQYIHKHIKAPDPILIGVDIQDVSLSLDGLSTYVQDMTDREGVQQILDTHEIETFDLIVSDMAPATIGTADIDALRSINLIESSYRIYQQYLRPGGKFVVKLFMGPGFDDLVSQFKKDFGPKGIKLFKPKASRKESKEIFLVKR